MDSDKESNTKTRADSYRVQIGKLLPLAEKLHFEMTQLFEVNRFSRLANQFSDFKITKFHNFQGYELLLGFSSQYLAFSSSLTREKSNKFGG